MTVVTFYEKKIGGIKKIFKISLSGHSGYAEAGSDIVCAALSSSLELLINTLCEEFGLKGIAKISMQPEPPEIIFDLSQYFTADKRNGEDTVLKIIKGFFLHTKNIEKDYPRFVKTITKNSTEV